MKRGEFNTDDLWSKVACFALSLAITVGKAIASLSAASSLLGSEVLLPHITVNSLTNHPNLRALELAWRWVCSLSFYGVVTTEISVWKSELT